MPIPDQTHDAPAAGDLSVAHPSSGTAPSDAGATSTASEPSAMAVLRAQQAARVLAASLLGRLPLGAAPLALLIFARETMTLTVAGVLVGAFTAGTAVGQPMFARMADRWRQPPVLWLAAAISTIGFLLTAAQVNLPVTVFAAGLAGLGAPPFESCLRVLWRDLLPPHQVQAAYTLDVAVQEAIFILGPMVTLAAVALTGPRGGLAAAALFQAVGTLWFATTGAVRRWLGEPAVRHWAGPLRAGRFRPILGALLLVGTAVGSVTVAATGYAESVGSRSWTGWLLAAQATGALVGGLLYVRFTALRQHATLPRAVGVFAAGYLPLLFTPVPPVMMALMALSGLALPPLLTLAFVAIDEVAPAGTAAEAFAWAATAFSVGSAAGAAAGGALLDAVGELTVGFLLAPLGGAAACGILLLSAGTSRSRANRIEPG
ncbi:MFS transporter [Micromonospora sp. DR5-3]|uniref:MFS transporter n=1 Tax=unclassified Micromonospora TaxID=2617518 RepID=UPI0011DB3696|nr:MULTISPECIES: MFS transporter [unclassified Micromonospora]MCW3819727.1 MFS transporter [Micromonospora sp. DR5-3]TYC23308.1 MFS transporter [Micromonospora sp. MP36]